MAQDSSGIDTADFDVIVVGAGMGGIYAIHRLLREGLSVQGFEGAPGVGGVWHHNSYPGARVDVEGYYYSYHFDPGLFREWHWSERYPSQPELEAYLNFAADRYGVKPHIAFDNWVTEAQWVEDGRYYRVTTDAGRVVTARYLVMATGQLSKPRRPGFPGLDDFAGEWVQTSHWPKPTIPLDGRRIAVVGTGSSGVQTIVAVAPVAEHLTVFQRTPNYSAPAYNAPVSDDTHASYADRAGAIWDYIIHSGGGGGFPVGIVKATQLTPQEQQERLEEHWAWGGQAMVAVFPDQGTDIETNRIVSEFVEQKVRAIVADPVTAEALAPNAYPIGTKRVAVDLGYYETYNRDNVTLIDVNADPIERIIPEGIRTAGGDHPVDLIIFALGFDAFTGSLDNANIRNAKGLQPSDGWKRGPRTYLGLMTRGFPNLFIMTGPGSPSVLANMFSGNVHHGDYIAELLAWMRDNGHTRIEPSGVAQDEWTAHVQAVATPFIRLSVDNYLVHVNADDGSRVFIPYIGGFARYFEACAEVAADGYRGFEFD